MKKLIIISSVLFAILLIIYFWASSPLVDMREIKSIINYQGKNDLASDTIKVLSYNIGYLSGLTNNKAKRLSENEYYTNLLEVRDSLKLIGADIAAFQEIDFNSERSYEMNQHDSLAKSFDYPYGSVAINWNMRHVPFPYFPFSSHFGKMLSGQSILSRYFILQNLIVTLPKPESRPFWYKKFYLDRLIQHNIIKHKMNIHVFNVHLEAFKKETRELHAKILVDYIKKFENEPYILLGDFNSIPPDANRKYKFPDEPDSDFRNDKTINYILSNLSIKYSIEDSLVNSLAINTFPSNKPNRKLDYVFYNPVYFKVLEYRTVQLKTSDHLPVITKLKWIK